MMERNKLDAASKRAEFLFDEFIESVQDEDEENIDLIIYILWVNFMHFLIATGMCQKQLIEDCIWHVEEATSEGHA